MTPESNDKITQVLAKAKSSDPPKVATSKVISLLARNNGNIVTTSFTKLIRYLFFNGYNDLCHSFILTQKVHCLFFFKKASFRP